MTKATFKLLVANHVSQIESRKDWQHGIVQGLIYAAEHTHGYEFGRQLGEIVWDHVDAIDQDKIPALRLACGVSPEPSE